MSKRFSYEEKVEAVRQYMEEGKGCSQIARAYITSESVIRRWVTIFKIHGNEGLKEKPKNIVYSQERIDMILKDVIDNNLSETYASAKYNVSHCIISRWRVKYLRGYTVKNKRVITREQAEKIREKYKNEKDPKVREILERNEYLEMENEALKKLQALTEHEK